MSVDLGAGNNRLTLNGRQRRHAEQRGDAGRRFRQRRHHSRTALSNASIDLGAGNDTLTFGNFTNTATVANVETITGGTGNDSVTLASALTGGRVGRSRCRQQQADPGEAAAPAQ